ncbi:hypothetical protein RND81_04G119300 [Saponaria officinalis]|uniref:Uncharacterized protein n=1 Tax=Saponaria officinalis TaxID=3572 RepID=A0AAW1LE12_SAPOF
MQLPDPRLDFDSRVLTEITFHDNPHERPTTSIFRVKFFLKLVDRRAIYFFNYINNSRDITNTPSFNIYPNNESSWKTVKSGLKLCLCLGNDSIQKVIHRVQTYIYWKPRPTWLVVFVNKVVVNEEA